MNRIKELRKKAGMTQTQLGRLLNVSQGTVSAWESEEAQVDVETLKSLAECFGVSIDYLIGYEKTGAQPSEGQPPADMSADPAPAWNVEYPPGVAARVIPRPGPSFALSDADIARIAERVAMINRESVPGPSFTPAEKQLVEEFRMLSPAQRTRVQRMIASFLDSKFMEE